MPSNFMNATVIAIIYFLFRFVEMRIVLKENKPLKSLLRDSLLVYMSIIAGFFLIEQIAPITEGLQTTPVVFKNDPDF